MSWWVTPGRTSRAAATGVALVVGALIVLTGVLLHAQREPLTDKRVTTGTVVDTRFELDSRGMPQQHEVVRFRTQHGHLVTFTDPTVAIGLVRLGSRVPVAYRTRNPNDAKIESVIEQWVPWAIVMIGALTLLYGLVSLRRAWLASRRRRAVMASGAAP